MKLVIFFFFLVAFSVRETHGNVSLKQEFIFGMQGTTAWRARIAPAALIFNDSRIIHIAEKFKRLSHRIWNVFHQTFSIGFACALYNARLISGRALHT